MPRRVEAGQYSGFLHAGPIGALIDTTCGFAAATVVGRVLASHFSVNCLRPAIGERLIDVRGWLRVADRKCSRRVSSTLTPRAKRSLLPPIAATSITEVRDGW